MTSRQPVPSPCSNLSTNKSLSITFGYIGEVCLNNVYSIKVRYLSFLCTVNSLYIRVDRSLLGSDSIVDPFC